MIKNLQFVLLALFLGASITAKAQCLFSDTTLETQADVDAFVSLYSDCATMNYNLTIGTNSTQAAADPVTDISGLSFITTVEKGLTIQYTDLTSLNGLQNITSIGESFAIQYNDNLTSLNGLQGLTAIGTNTSIANSALLIYTNPVLTDLTALQNLTSLNEGTISVQYSDALNSLNGLENIDGATIRHITIRYNTQLTNCSVQGLCEALNLGVLVNINIYDNAGGCDSEIQVVAGCGGYESCPTENIVLETQADVDGFVLAYQNCTTISESANINLWLYGLNVESDFITDISGFSQFTNMQFTEILITETELTNLDGLQGVTSAGAIEITYNSNLTSLDGLQGVNNTNELIIENNPNLVSIEGLINLEQLNLIGATSTVLRLRYNDVLTNLNGLQNLQSVNGGRITFQYNNSLVDISALDNVDVTALDRYTIRYNTSLALCNVQSVCNYLALGTENIDLRIAENAPGCYDVTEVSVACSTDLCPSGDVTLTSQAELDAFGATYPNCSSIGGVLTVNGSDVINLNGIANIHYAGGLVIQNTQLTTLDDITINGLNGNVEISGNTQLTSIAAFSSIASLGGSISIINNDALTSLSGLENIENINTDAMATIGLEISDNDNLTDITALSALETLNGSELIIDNNAVLTTLSGLDNVFANTISNLSIQNNNSLISASVASVCIYLNNSFPATISGNATGADTSTEVLNNCNLPDCPPPGDFVFDRETLDYFKIQYPNCTELDGNVVFSNLNDVGGDLSGLDNITSITGTLRINSNMGYSSLTGLENLTSIGESFLLHDCDNLINLQGLNGLTSVGTSGADYIDLYIHGNENLQNLSGLEGLTTLIGNIDINITNNPALTSLEGLNNVTSIITTPSIFGIDDTFNIVNNENLTSLEGLNSLQTLYSHLNLRDLPALADVSALSNLVSITGDVIFQNCDALTTFSGLENLNSINGNLFIRYNDALQNLNSLNSLQTVSILEVYNNTSLTSIQGLGSLTSVDNISIIGNTVLPSLDGLEGLTAFSLGNFQNNISLTSIEGLQNITTAYSAVFTDNINLTSLAGLNNLQAVYQIYFENNNIASLEPLSNLTIAEVIGIVNENNMTSLSGLENIDPEIIYILAIYNNDLLSTCAVESICGYLALDPDEDYYLIDNNTGDCLTEAEVIDACAALSIDEADLATSVISFYPNPTQDDLYMDVKGNIEVQNITIYNITGQLVKTLKGSHELINIATLAKGLYFVKVNATNGTVYTQKVVKN